MLQGESGSPEDKLRLVILYLLVSEKLPQDSDVEAIQSALQSCQADLDALQYVLRMRQMNLTGSSMMPGAGASASRPTGGWLVDSKYHVRGSRAVREAASKAGRVPATGVPQSRLSS